MDKKENKEQKLSLVREASAGGLVHWPQQMAMALYDFRATKKQSSWETYEVALRTFFTFIGQLGLRSPDEVTRTHLTSYIELLRNDGKADRTIRNYCAAASSFFQFLSRPMDTKGTALIKSNPWDGVRDALPKVTPYDKSNNLREFTPEEYQKLIATCDRQTVIGKRDYAIMVTALWTVRRREELARLRRKDFGEEGGKVWIRFLQKGGKHLLIDLIPPVWEAIQDYWASSKRTMKAESPAWIATTDAWKHLNRARNLRIKEGEQPLVASALDSMLKSHGRQAGLDETVVSVHMHGLRHLGARMLRAMKIDLKEIKERLGHADLRTTDIYLGSMDRIGAEGLEQFAKAVMGT